MNEIGYAALLLAFVSTGYGTVASIVGARTGRWEYVKSAERAVYAYCASVSVAGFALCYALLSSDFSNEYVYQYTSLDLSWFYKASAFWAGNSGSMLLWLLIPVSYTHLRAHETDSYLVCRLLLEKKKKT